MGKLCVLAIVASALVVGACAGQLEEARVYPLDTAAMSAGISKIEITRRPQHGPVTVTMPNGEVLTGEYQLTENAAIGVGFAGSQMVTSIGLAGSRPVVVSATGDHTIFNCEGAADLGGHGSLICQTSQGNKYRVMF